MVDILERRSLDEQRANLRIFLETELAGVDISGEDDDGIFQLFDVMAICAEGLAQAFALQQSGIDPEDPRFLSESITERTNRPGAMPVFDVDIDHELRHKDVVDASVTEWAYQRAEAMAQQLVYEAVEERNLIAMRNGGQ